MSTTTNTTSSSTPASSTAPAQAENPRSAQEITELVRESYAAVSKSSGSRTVEQKGDVARLAEGLGYSKEELAAIPEEANMGLQCGNPTRLAGLKEGEVVLDLGSGGGVDVFLAATKVGPRGKAIGVDMTAEMVEQARQTQRERGVTNVEFLHANITAIPLPENSVDVIISNCVINLAPNKMDVFKEMYRVLRPGGRVAVSDIVQGEKKLPAEIQQSVAAIVGCVGGALPQDEYAAGLRAVGFSEVSITDGKKDLNASWNEIKQGSNQKLVSCCACSEGSCGATATTAKPFPLGMPDLNVNDYFFSGQVAGVKPHPTTAPGCSSCSECSC